MPDPVRVLPGEPARDESRLRVLRSTQLLDSSAEHAFDRLSRLASRLLTAPVALVSLVDDRRQFFKSALGLEEPWASLRETPLTHSFCQYAVRDRARLVVRDAREDPVLRENPAIRDLHVIAYAGIPLIVAGEAIGAFCVIDERPRQWSEEELGVLDDLAGAVVSEIELRLALRTTRDQHALIDAVLESLGDGVLAVDTSRAFLVANAAARRMFDGPAVGKILPAAWSVAHRSTLSDGSPLAPEDGALPRGLRGEKTERLAFTVQPPRASEPIWVEASGRAVHGEGGEIIAAVSVYRDVTERKREAEELQRARDLLAHHHTLLEATLANIEDGVTLLDSERRVLLANATYASMFGIEETRLPGLTREDFIAHVATLVEDPEVFAERMERPVQPPSEEVVFLKPRRRVLRRTWTALRLSSKECFLVTWHDVTFEKDLLAERERQLLSDPLTGIPNRRAAEAALGVEGARSGRGGAPLSVAMFDIDWFKRVNDDRGHAAGDEVLRQVAATLTAGARVTDTVARWGGEEFLAVLPGALDGAIAFCERARVSVERLRFPGAPRVTISAGVAQVNPGEPLASAVARADERLYEAKRGGRNRVIA